MDAAPDPLVRIEGVAKSFGGQRVIEGLDLAVARGGFFALLGRSGSGKTTILRMLAGFEAPDEGRIVIDGRDMADAPPHERPVNIMFQSYALFPHMSVADNIGYGLKRMGMPAPARCARVAEMLALVRLEGFGGRRPHQLSGGQRQRVALARALARRPALLLLDEPLGALDRRLREAMQVELKALQRSLGVTFLVVTHDQEEALGLADTVAVIESGRIQQCAAPREIYERPANRFVAGFLGSVNLIEARVASGQGFVLPDGAVLALRPPEGLEAGRLVTLAIRPERLRLAAAAEGAPRLRARATGEVYLGKETVLEARLDDGAALSVLLPAGFEPPPPGAPLELTFDPAQCRVLVA